MYEEEYTKGQRGHSPPQCAADRAVTEHRARRVPALCTASTRPTPGFSLSSTSAMTARTAAPGSPSGRRSANPSASTARTTRPSTRARAKWENANRHIPEGPDGLSTYQVLLASLVDEYNDKAKGTAKRVTVSLKRCAMPQGNTQGKVGMPRRQSRRLARFLYPSAATR